MGVSTNRYALIAVLPASAVNILPHLFLLKGSPDEEVAYTATVVFAVISLIVRFVRFGISGFNFYTHSFMIGLVLGVISILCGLVNVGLAIGYGVVMTCEGEGLPIHAGYQMALKIGACTAGLATILAVTVTIMGCACRPPPVYDTPMGRGAR